MSKTSYTDEYKPPGLLVPIHATIKGKVRWQVLDERMVPEIPRGPNGFPLGPIEGIEQDNLITDHGMNRIAVLNLFSTAVGAGGWRGRLAVGTGTALPAVTDTTLQAEVQRDATSGAFPAGANTFRLDTTANNWVSTSMVTRIVIMTADRNLTEYGFAEGATADIHIRERLRDGGGNPTTVTLLNGRSLRVDHTAATTIAAPSAGHTATINIQEFDAAGVLVSTTAYSILFGLWANDLANESFGLRRMFKECWAPHIGQTTPDRFNGLGPITLTAYARQLAAQDAGVARAAITLEPYVGGSFQRIKRGLVPTGSFNQVWNQYTMAFDTTANHGRSGLYVRFTSPTSFTKANTHTLHCGMISTWARG